jgi:glycerophosphoryl diester phosphodiesterase
VQQRLPSLIRPPIGFAHRGARAHARDNTLASFKLALRLGATGLESDVWLTADGVPVLDHDGIVVRGLRRTAIGRLNRVDLPPHIPTVAELLAECGTEFDLSLDLKDDHAGPEVIEVIGALAPAMLRRVWLCHPRLSVVASLRGLSSVVRLVDSTRLGKIVEGPERRAASLADVGVDALNMHHTDWSGGLVALFHRFNRTCFAWDLQQPAQLHKLLLMGVDGVYSDWVDRMVEAIAEVG